MTLYTIPDTDISVGAAEMQCDPCSFDLFFLHLLATKIAKNVVVFSLHWIFKSHP